MYAEDYKMLETIQMALLVKCFVAVSTEIILFITNIFSACVTCVSTMKLFASVASHGLAIDDLLVVILPFACSIFAFTVDLCIGFTVFAIEVQAIGALEFTLIFTSLNEFYNDS